MIDKDTALNPFSLLALSALIMSCASIEAPKLSCLEQTVVTVSYSTGGPSPAIAFMGFLEDGKLCLQELDGSSHLLDATPRSIETLRRFQGSQMKAELSRAARHNLGADFADWEELFIETPAGSFAVVREEQGRLSTMLADLLIDVADLFADSFPGHFSIHEKAKRIVRQGVSP